MTAQIQQMIPGALWKSHVGSAGRFCWLYHVKNSGRSITAAIQGFVDEAGGPEHFAGIILNQVHSESHADYLSKACASLQIPILGALPEIPELRWPERHLGLQPEVEQDLPGSRSFSRIGGKIF